MREPNIRRWLVPSVIVIILLLILSLGHVGSGSNIVGAVAGGNADTTAGDYGGPVDVPTAPGPSPRAPGGTRPGQPAVGGVGTVITDKGLMFPLASGAGGSASLTSFAGRRAIGDHVRVQAVVANEGFWIGTSSRNRIWVQLVGPPPESPYSVREGDTISFNAPVVAHSARFAPEVGVSRAEGARQLTAQGAHIAIRKTKLKLYR